MPVVDTPVHPTTVDSGKWGCYNRPDFRPWYYSKRQIMIIPIVGKLLSLIGVYSLEKTPYVNSMDCHHGKAGGDHKCQDCFRRINHEESK